MSPQVLEGAFSVRAARRSDHEEVLALHLSNHFSALPSDEQAQGFVTLDLGLSHLETLQKNGLLLVARGPGEFLAGYVLAAPWEFYSAWPVFSVQTERFPLPLGAGFAQSELRRGNSFQYGPVCVARGFRGRGVLQALFGEVKSRMAPRFPLGATFINARNERSLAAHTRKLGFAIVDEWRAGSSTYFTLAFST